MQKAGQAQQSVRRGAILVLAAVLMIVVVAFVALTVDIGYIAYTKAQLQHAADAAALAACRELAEGLGTAPQLTTGEAARTARTAAHEVAAEHRAGDRASVPIDTSRNVIFGQAETPASGPWNVSWGAGPYNVVKVTAAFDGQAADTLPLFFAPALGHRTDKVQASATAAMAASSGFKITPGSSVTAPFLPFAYDLPSWLLIEANSGPDEWGFDATTREPVHQPDGVPEFNLYPDPNDLLPSGNRGTVSLGKSGSANSLNNLRRWIEEGTNANDLAEFGGELGNDQCPLELEGYTGLKASLEGNLEEIRGEARVIPLFSTVTGKGANTTYTIERFVGIRILEVELNGGNKRVIAQPAAVIHSTAVPGKVSTSDLFRTPHLIQ